MSGFALNRDVWRTLAAIAVVWFAWESKALSADCGSLAGKSFGPAMITAATSVSPPSSLVGMDPPTPTPIKSAFCRVEGTIKPTPDSDIRFEVWLPPTEAWNGKYQAVGNGGFAGSLIYPAMAWGLDAAYAVSGTDTGHSGGSLDSTWALGRPEKIADFGWRAIHETALASKAVIEAYYGKAPSHAYFNGCSDGGREALMEAQRFPADYDGIVAGAPANFWTKLEANAEWAAQAVGEPGAWLSPANLSLVTSAALKACGGASGYLDDPSACRFDPSTLVCKPGQTESCLTDAQVGALKKLYSGANDDAGKAIGPGYAVGGEAGATAWPLWITGNTSQGAAGSLLSLFATGHYANLVFDKPDLRIAGRNVGDDFAASVKKAGEALDADNPDLGAFKAAGGKLIQYHGWNDAAIPPQNSLNYYTAVANKMGGVEQVQSFYRLFFAPGMEHCGVGPGPSAVGGVFGLPSPSRDPEHDVVAALARWVEQGAAPEKIVATRYRDNNPTEGIEAQRPWCPYPVIARYSEKGERTAASSFACTADK
jgi:feruloyl esterase